MPTRREFVSVVDSQPELIDVGERQPAEKHGAQRRWFATPAPIGSGPAGETCKTCQFYTRARIMSGSIFLKCGLMKKHWTHGKGTDIKASYAACSEWKPTTTSGGTR